MIGKNFFDFIKTNLFKSGISQQQVDNINIIVDTCNKYGVVDKRQQAYVLATTYHETAATMQPIAEIGSDNYLSKYGKPPLMKNLGNLNIEDGIKYKGRGYCMITGRTNYTKFSKLLNIDLVNHPDSAMSPSIAAQIIVVGMRDGLFTGVKLNTYFGKTTDAINARRIINVTDRAALIAGYYSIFLTALNK